MDEFDRKIAEALERDAAEQFGKLSADQSLIEMMVGGFRGRHAWMNIMMACIMVVLMVVCIFCTIEFFRATALRAMMSWGFGSAVSFYTMSFLKLWFWLEMQRNATVREVKRVQVQIASLSQELRGGKGHSEPR